MAGLEGRAVVVVVAGDAAEAGRLAGELDRAGARVAVFDPGDRAGGHASPVDAVVELVAELFGPASP